MNGDNNITGMDENDKAYVLVFECQSFPNVHRREGNFVGSFNYQCKMTKKQKTWTWIKNMNMSKKREHEHKFCLTSEDYTKKWLRSKHVKWFKRAVSCRRKCEELIADGKVKVNGVQLYPIDFGFREENGLLVPAINKRLSPDNLTLNCNCVKCATIRCTCR